MPSSKVRLSFRLAKSGTEQVAMVAPEYAAILKAAGSKLKLSKKALKRMRLEVDATGVELLPNDPNLAKCVSNGSVIVVHLEGGGGDVGEPSIPSKQQQNDNDNASEATTGMPTPPLAPSRYCNNTKQSDAQVKDKDPDEEESEADVEESTAAATAPTSFATTASPTLPLRPAAVMTNLQFHPGTTFPVLEGNVLPLIREAVSGNSAFVESDMGDYIAFDYKDVSSNSATFPNPFDSNVHYKTREKFLLAARRECRGLLICRHTGKVLRRAFHKFFNVNEVPETSSIELSADDCLILEKMDGSLVSPLVLSGEIVWATRKSIQPELNKFCVTSKIADYTRLAEYCIHQNKTPLFEWCVAGQAVGVVQHDTTSVTLLAIRDMKTGMYSLRSEVEEICQKYRVPIVEPMTTLHTGEELAKHSMPDLVTQIAAEPAPLEGVVAISNRGQALYKVKTLWYVSMATASKRAGSSDTWGFLLEFCKKRPSLQGIPPEKLWKAALGNNASTSDDSRALVMSLLSSVSEAEQFSLFLEYGDQALNYLHKQLKHWSSKFRNEIANNNSVSSGSMEEMIAATSAASGWPRRLLRAYVQSKNAPNSMTNLREELMQQSVQELQACFGFSWNETQTSVEEISMDNETGTDKMSLPILQKLRHGPPQLEQEPSELDAPQHDDPTRYVVRSNLFPSGSLDKPPKGIADHVCDTYLLRKIANYLGKPKTAMMDETKLLIKDNYLHAEGKIKGMWEQFAKKNIVDLRIDLQPSLSQKHQAFGDGGGVVTEHLGTTEWALLLVQYGPNPVAKKSSRVKEQLPSGSFAGIFLETNTIHCYGDIRRAMRCSFDERCLVFLTSPQGIPKVPELDEMDRRKYGEKDCIYRTRTTHNKSGSGKEDDSTPWTVYVDLDGVLADFDRALLAASGKRSGDFANANAMWRFIMSAEHDFFAKLPWTEHGERLWTFLQQLKLEQEGVISEIKVLTGVPPSKNGGKSVTRQKRTWCADKLGKDVEVIACSSREKYRWSGHKCILIDDHLLQQEKWASSGGIFLHYTGKVSHLERHFRTLVLPFGGLSVDEKEAIGRVRSSAGGRISSSYLDDDQIHYVKGSEEGKHDLFASTVCNLSNGCAVGVDCEWRPDELNLRAGTCSAASVVQISLNGLAFVIDTQEMSPVTRRALVELFSPQKNAEWQLIFFGSDQDVHRIVAAVPEILSFHNEDVIGPLCVDLQQVCGTFGLFTDFGKDLISLSDVAEAVVGRSLDKSVRKVDWSKRPLSFAQIQYAAHDAHCCVKVWEAIAMEECLRSAVLTSMAESLVMPQRSMLQRKYKRISANQTTSGEGKVWADSVVFANPATVLSAPPSSPVRPHYTAVFLTSDSSKTLLEAFPPKHRNVLADHVTLAYAPEPSALAGLPIGETCRLHVSQILSDAKSQVARVSVLDNLPSMDGFMQSPQTAHITMSTAANVAASGSVELLHTEHAAKGVQKDNSNDSVAMVTADLNLEGIVGVLVKLTESEGLLASVSKSVLSKLVDFANQKVPGSTLKFRGGTLNSTERAAIHSFCEARGILSRSEGPKDKRQMTLSFPKFFREDGNQTSETAGEGRIVESANDLDDTKGKKTKKLSPRDARNIASSYLCLSMDVFSLVNWQGQEEDPSCFAPVGELSFDSSTKLATPEIHFDPERYISDSTSSDESLLRSLITAEELPADVPKPVVVIMRGLPGSGKSSFARALKHNHSSDGSVAIVSADSFFERKGTYDENFDECQLDDAHEFCRIEFARELLDEDRAAVIVDNTNSSLREYKFYIQKARQAGKRFLVVEMLCRSESELRDFYHRGLHRVSMQTMGRMRGRWESDENSLPFLSTMQTDSSQGSIQENESLRVWLSQNHMCHNVKARQKTYLNMAGLYDPNETQFITVPQHLEIEFLRRYANDQSAWFLAEYATTPLFPFFCDIDQTYTSQDDALDMLGVASSLSKVLRRLWDGSRQSNVIVVGTLEGKHDAKAGHFHLGCHLHCPNTLLTREEALKLRAHLIQELETTCEEGRKYNWDKIVDSTVYDHMTLRLLGSNKPGPERRLYSLVGVVGVNGLPDYNEENKYKQDRLQLLLDCSVRQKYDIQSK